MKKFNFKTNFTLNIYLYNIFWMIDSNFIVIYMI